MQNLTDARRTEIVENVEIKLEDLIATDVEMAITVSHAGYIRRTPMDVYRHQSRGGEGESARKRAMRISSSTFSWPRRTATFCCSAPRAACTG